MQSFSPPVERCRPLLGTFVRIRVHGLTPELAHAAIDAAFDTVAVIQRLMSFRHVDSDVSRLNREAWRHPVAVDAQTYEVLQRAALYSELTDGLFDVTIARELVGRGFLPPPPGAPAADPDGDWCDIALLDGQRVAFRRRIWIELGGIAKGYAVDRASAALRAFSPTQMCVNAGGDLKVAGAGAERIRLVPDAYAAEVSAFADVKDSAVASSFGRAAGGRHIDRRRSSNGPSGRFVTVSAPHCVDADALTKVVMALGSRSRAVLARCSAIALTFDAKSGWREIVPMRDAADQ